MPRIFPEYKRSTVYAMIGAMFHFIVVVLPFSLFELYSLLSGKGYGGKLIEVYVHFVFFVVYLPFAFLNINLRQLLANFDLSWQAKLYITMAIGGTIFYTLSGWLIGYGTDKFLRRRQIIENQKMTGVIL